MLRDTSTAGGLWDGRNRSHRRSRSRSNSRSNRCKSGYDPDANVQRIGMASESNGRSESQATQRIQPRDDDDGAEDGRDESVGDCLGGLFVMAVIDRWRGLGFGGEKKPKEEGV